jgi:hypothetical protein
MIPSTTTRRPSASTHVGDADRVGLHRQALDWLRANLELRTELLKHNNAADWPLTTWQTDPALGGVCDRDALAKLPDAEREQWQQLWTDVAAILAADSLEQGRAHAARREWDKVADSYSRFLERGRSPIFRAESGSSGAACVA